MLGDISVLDKVYIVCGRTDMRKQIDGLCVIIEEQLAVFEYHTFLHHSQTGRYLLLHVGWFGVRI